jgi:hypothetical protein
MLAISNIYEVDLEDNEKVVFNARLSKFGTEKDFIIGGKKSCFTLTNKRIIVDNGFGVWSAEIEEDVVSIAKVETGFLFFRSVYFSIDLNTEIVFDYGRRKLSGFHFYFDEAGMAEFEVIANNLNAKRVIYSGTPQGKNH